MRQFLDRSGRVTLETVVYMTDTAPEVGVGRREERKQQNRAKLLAAARKVFAEKGFGEATARDIVRETDLATGTFYNYFTDKDDAFRALLQEVFEQPVARAREQRLQPSEPLEVRVTNAYRAFFEWVVEERDLFQVFRRNASAIAVMDEGGLFETGITGMVEDFSAWVAAGELPADVDLDYVATAVAGMVFQVATHMVEREPPDVEGATRFCARWFLGGVRALADE
jgi:AcrR family transcriptional regulator